MLVPNLNVGGPVSPSPHGCCAYAQKRRRAARLRSCPSIGEYLHSRDFIRDDSNRGSGQRCTGTVASPRGGGKWWQLPLFQPRLGLVTGLVEIRGEVLVVGGVGVHGRTSASRSRLSASFALLQKLKFFQLQGASPLTP